jgi:redox-sensitive bicupin YhaK (pirin superfamily)
LHGIQAWVALPKEQEEVAPSFYHYSGGWLPKWSEPGVVGQLIAGNAYGLTADAVTHSPLFYAHLDMEPGSTAEIPGGYKERAIYVATGAVELGGTCYEGGRMLVVTRSPREQERCSIPR